LAEKTLRAFAGHLKANPNGSPALAQAVAMYIDSKQIDPQVVHAKHETQSGGAKKSDSVVKAKADAEKIAADGKQVITLSLKIDDGWHLYANPIPDDFPGIPVSVTVEGKAKPKDVKVEYPTGKLVKDALAGDHHIYEKEAKIKVIVTREKGDTGPLDVSIKVQSCSKQTCLVPGTIKLTVP
jgi:DsbC/DsbD-like thiol-disulfide interchange protein